MRKEELKRRRSKLQLSQSRLARLAGVPRFRLAFFELGDRPLSEEDQKRLLTAIREEAIRLQGISAALAKVSKVHRKRAALPLAKRQRVIERR